MEIIQSTVGAPIQIIDSAFWIAREVKSMLNAVNARSGASEQAKKKVRCMLPNFRKAQNALLPFFCVALHQK